MSYGNYYIWGDIRDGLSKDEIVRKIIDRYPDITRPQAEAIYKSVKQGGPEASAPWPDKSMDNINGRPFKSHENALMEGRRRYGALQTNEMFVCPKCRKEGRVSESNPKLCTHCAGEVKNGEDVGPEENPMERKNINGRPFKLVVEHEEGCKCEQCRHRGRADNGLTVHENALKEGRKKYGSLLNKQWRDEPYPWAVKAWRSMSREERLRALKETGSWKDDVDKELDQMGGGSQVDVLEDWIKMHKL